MTEETTQTKQPIKLPVFKMDGSRTGEEIELSDNLFGLPRNNHILYLAVKTEMTRRRQGTRSTKGRSEVSGGGKKPWRQKGRGGARAGTIRSPLWVGGGITFGPKPQNFDMKLPKKMKLLARKTAFSVKAQNNGLVLIEDFSMDEPKTKKIYEMLKSLELNEKSVLLLVNGNHPQIVKSCRNIPRIEVRESTTASTRDILKARKVIIQKSALEALVGGLVNA